MLFPVVPLLYRCVRLQEKTQTIRSHYWAVLWVGCMVLVMLLWNYLIMPIYIEANQIKPKTKLNIGLILIALLIITTCLVAL